MKKTLLLLGLFITGSAFAQNPTLYNDEFTTQPKSSGSDCACAGWVNKNIGDQGESTTTGLTDPNTGVKFDNLEADIIYQEIAVLPNTNYKITYSYRINDDTDEANANSPSSLEIRVLKGSAYVDDYTPLYEPPAVAAQQDFGYREITAVELESNNIVPATILTYPGTTDYIEAFIEFTTGSETSIALFARGTGRPNTAPVDNKEFNGVVYPWSAGKDETRLDYMRITNEGTASVNSEKLASVSIYPNPASNSLVIRSLDVAVDSYELFNLLGMKVLNGATTGDRAIDVSGLSSGMYLIKVNSGTDSTTRRIVIQ